MLLNLTPARPEVAAPSEGTAALISAARTARDELRGMHHKLIDDLQHWIAALDRDPDDAEARDRLYDTAFGVLEWFGTGNEEELAFAKLEAAMDLVDAEDVAAEASPEARLAAIFGDDPDFTQQSETTAA